MADKNSGANAGRNDLTDSDMPTADPFAELTRIMGFDPRKVEGGAAATASASTADDFKIDLEKELMHEFNDDEIQPDNEQHHEVASAFDEPLPQIEALAEPVEEIEPDVEHRDEATVAYDESVAAQQPVEDLPAEDLMESELTAPQAAAEEDVPVIKLSAPSREQEQAVAEEEVQLFADAEPVNEAELEAEFNALLGNQDQHEILDTSAEQLAAVAQTSVPEENAAAQPAVSIATPEEDFSVEFGFPEPVAALDRVPETEPEVTFEATSNEEDDAEKIEAVAAEQEEPDAEVKAQEPAVAEEDDPFAMLAAMAQKYRVSEPDDSWRKSSVQFSRATPQLSRDAQPFSRESQQPAARVEPRAPVIETARIETIRTEAPRPFVQAQAATAAPVPEIETVDVHDRAVAMVDDLDIPEIEVAEEPPVVRAADDLDAEFNNLLQQMSTPQAAPAPQRPVHSYAEAAARPVQPAYQPQPAPVREAQQERYAAEPSYERSAVQPTPQPQAERPVHTESYERAAPVTNQRDDDDIRIDLTEDDLAEAFDDFDTAAMDDFDLDGDFEEDLAPRSYQHQPAYQQPKRRGLLVAAIVGGVAILGVAGAVAMSMMGDAQGSAPEMVRADQAPFKVRPENPGGTVAPNQDSKVYETVARTGDANRAPQQALINNTEEPIDLPDQLPDNADEDLALADDGAAKSEDRIQPAAASEAGDGETLAVAPRKVRTMVVKPDGTLAPREETEPQVRNEATPQNDAAAASAPVEDEITSAIAANDAQASPAENPQAAAPANVAPETTASIQPQPAVEGGWTMQIASESSEEAAKSTYQKMLGRYGNVLDGKGVNILKADIEGKGTFWRIRIPAESRDAAASMCNSFKSAGGKCFVTKS